MPPTIEDMHAEGPATATLRNTVAVLQAKLDQLARYSLYEYEAKQEGLDDCAQLFRSLARRERRDVDEVVAALCVDRRGPRRLRAGGPLKEDLGRFG